MFSAIILAVSSNLDDLTVAFSLGLKDGVLRLKEMLIIAFISGLTMGTGLYLGKIITGMLPGVTAEYVSAVLFISFGLWFLVTGLGDKQKIRLQVINRYDFLVASRRSLFATISLGFLLGIGSLILGFSGGLGGFPPVFTTIMTGVSSFVFLWSGSLLGGRISGLIGKKGNYIVALFLILLGLGKLCLL
ncbi:MAG: hypothetical protein ACOCQ1_04690 [Halanaerobiaceae bacterium]